MAKVDIFERNMFVNLCCDRIEKNMYGVGDVGQW